MLDPASSWSGEPAILSLIFETLTDYDLDTKEVIPRLATSWESNDDATEWTFHLRPNVTFHDGTPFNADAVEFSINRTKAGTGAAYLYSMVTGFEKPDPLTITIKLSEPAPLALMLGGAWGGYITSPSSGDQPPEWWNEGQGIGTGPYMWTSYAPGDTAVVDRYPDYWGGWQDGQVTKVVFTYTPDANTRQQLVESGQAQMTNSLPVFQLPNLSSNANLNVATFAAMGTQGVLFNTVKAPTDNVLVRKALAYAFPIDAIMAANYDDGQFVTKNTTSYTSHANLIVADIPDGFEFDLDKARAFLAEAGYPDGGITVDIAPNVGAATGDDTKDLELWAGELAKIGVTLNILRINDDQRHSLQRTDPQQRPSFTSSWTPDFPTPYGQLTASFTPAGVNEGSYDNPTFTALLDKAHAESATDPEQSVGTFAEAQRILFDDMAGFPYLDGVINFIGYANVTNIRTSHGNQLDVYSLRMTD